MAVQRLDEHQVAGMMAASNVACHEILRWLKLISEKNPEWKSQLAATSAAARNLQQSIQLAHAQQRQKMRRAAGERETADDEG